MSLASVFIDDGIISALNDLDADMDDAKTAIAGATSSESSVTIFGHDVDMSGAAGSYAVGMLTDAASTCAKNIGTAGKAETTAARTVQQAVS